MKNMKKMINQTKNKVLAVLVTSGFALPAIAGSPLPISQQEEAQSGQGILQLFEGILDDEVILFTVIFFAIAICIGCLVGAYNAYKRFEEDEKLSKLIVGWIVCAIFFVLSGAFLYILYQVKNFTG